MKTESQNSILRKHLKSGKSIGPLTALNHYGIYRLAARISELRNQGMNIKTEMVHLGNNIKYAKYYL